MQLMNLSEYILNLHLQSLALIIPPYATVAVAFAVAVAVAVAFKTTVYFDS